MRGLIVIFAFFCTAGYGQTAEEVFQKSKETNKPVLLVFSGSDWCAPCIRFHKKVLGSSLFATYADEKLIVLKADFPQRTAQPEDERKRNEMLAEQFNPGGLFPHVLLVRHDRSVISTLKYINQTPEEFIAELGRHL